MLQRRVIAVEGVVQGVGFRPYVHGLASARDLRGSVRNGPGGVVIDVEGDAFGIDDFLRALPLAPPPLARIAKMDVVAAEPQAYGSFSIAESEASTSASVAYSVPADVATCDACLDELFDPANRRFGHPFITCTQCGPRFTIVQSAPYDRERTTMAQFPLCAECRREYEDPADRRFHAEAIACGRCGPKLRSAWTHDARTHEGHEGHAALDDAITALRAGKIVAIKALGGYHLACDARSDASVGALRERKHRPAKPFALMVRDVAEAIQLCEVSAAECALLESSARPIVLLARRSSGGVAIAEGVAPGQASLGIMLPSTPLHHLLLAALRQPLVMTSGNRGGEPVVIDEAAASESLSNIADIILSHDRGIAARADDSVLRVTAGDTRMIRRSRGFAPRAITLAARVPEHILAVGAHLKNSVCVASGTEAFLSAHVGDLETPASRVALRNAIAHTISVAGATPAVIAHDLHPDYASTQLAMSMDAERRVAVQHHHAHVAAAVAEHHLDGPVIGVVFDGAGLGSDGAVWGGEFLVVDGARFRRHGHLGYVALPGGDAVARRPWRAAAAHVMSATGQPAACPPTVSEREWQLVHQLTTRTSQPRTSSIGRLFDAVASLVGLCQVASYEGEAAMALEAAAYRRVARRYPVVLSDTDVWTADPAAIIRGVLDDLERGRDTGEIAGAFHATLADVVLAGCQRAREQTGVRRVVLSGGTFMNKLLLEQCSSGLAEHGFQAYLPRMVPCNDGGIALGQAYVAACALTEELCA